MPVQDEVVSQKEHPLSGDEVEELAEEFRKCFDHLRESMEKIVLGQEEMVRDCLIALFAGGHVLLEGPPGIGKTLLARSLAAAAGLRCNRIQCTPDLMPSDITGANILVETPEGGKRFEFQKGPVFTNLLLADEINRATPKTQSALLEAMQEGRVTFGGESRDLPSPFLTIATQNPLEMEGTYPLPEAQLDRFFFQLVLEFPDAKQLEGILLQAEAGPSAPLTPHPDAPGAERILAFRRLLPHVEVAPPVLEAASRLLLATQPGQASADSLVRKVVRYGASPRAGQALLLGAKIHALLDHRFHVAREDLDALVIPTLRHRIRTGIEADAEGVSVLEILGEVRRALRD